MSGAATERLLRAVFGAEWQRATVERFANGAVYYSVGLMKPGTTRKNENVERVYCLVFDDVGTKVDRDMVETMMPEANYGIESSPGNFQYGWVIDGGCEVSEFVTLRDGAAHRFGATEARAPSNLVRAPEGVSGKPKHPNWTVRLAFFNPGLRYTQADLMKAVGPGAPRRAPSTGPQKAPSLNALRALLREMPNDKGYDYDFWISVGIAIYGATEGSEEGRASWILWSEQQPPGDFLAADKWETFSGTTSAGWGALERLARKTAAEVFDDGEAPPGEEEENIALLVPEDTKKMPRRPWIYGKRLVRGYVSTTVAAGGVGKSSLTLVEAISMATGRDLLSVGPERMPRAPQRVWIWNGEDPVEEMKLRANAAFAHYGVNKADIGDRLYISSGRDSPMKLAAVNGKAGVVVNEALVRRIMATIRRWQIDVLIIDPLVSAHYVSENDNMQMDVVIKTIGRIAGECSCAVDLVHHTRKGNGEAASVDDARGAGAVINAARHLRVLTPMSKDVGDKHGIRNYRSYFCVSREAVKTNLTPPLDSDYWYRMVSFDMDNGEAFPADGGLPIPGESVGVAEKWALTIPNIDRMDMVGKCHALMTGKTWRHNEQAGSDWVGLPVSEALEIDLGEGKVARVATKEAIERWVRDGWLRKVQGMKGNRHATTFVEIGNEPPDF